MLNVHLCEDSENHLKIRPLAARIIKNTEKNNFSTSTLLFAQLIVQFYPILHENFHSKISLDILFYY